jgi:hypothetical protein
MRCFITSKGFMKASLAIVAQAPLEAGGKNISFVGGTVSERRMHLRPWDDGLRHYRPLLA